MTTVYSRLPVHPYCRVAVIVKTNVPVAFGVPESTPVEELSVNPPGNVPAVLDHEIVPVPPVAVNVWLYVAPCTELGRLGGSIVIVGQTTLVVYAWLVAQPLSSDIVMVKLYWPKAVGVPDKTPANDSDNPVGNAPEVRLK